MKRMSAELVHIQPPERDLLDCSVGIRDGAVRLRLGSVGVSLSAEQADQLAADLRLFALEIRNGGPLL